MTVPLSDDVNVYVESDPDEALDSLRSLSYQPGARLSDLGLRHCNRVVDIYHHLHRPTLRAVQSERRWIGCLLKQSSHLPGRLEHRDRFVDHHSPASHVA